LANGHPAGGRIGGPDGSASARRGRTVRSDPRGVGERCRTTANHLKRGLDRRQSGTYGEGAGEPGRPGRLRRENRMKSVERVPGNAIRQRILPRSVLILLCVIGLMCSEPTVQAMPMFARKYNLP